MALIEEVDDEVSNGDPGPSSSAELVRQLKDLTAQLTLPENLLPVFMAEEKRQYSPPSSKFREADPSNS